MPADPSHAVRSRVPALDDAHDRCAGLGQQKDSLTAFLAANGHPLALDYRVARERFDSLSWACGFGQRLYLFADPENQVQLSAPRLTIATDPKGWRGFQNGSSSDPHRWKRYAEAAAAAGFPPETAANGHLGRWTILVSDRGASARLREALTGFGFQWRPIGGRAEYRVFDASRFTRLETAFRIALLPEWELPPYTPPPPERETNAVPPVRSPLSTVQRSSPTEPPRRPARSAELSLFDCACQRRVKV